jgi:amidase
MDPVHAFSDDALGTHDAVGLAAAVASGQVSVRELVEAAAARAEAVNPVLNAIQHSDVDRARAEADRPRTGVLAGVPTFVKDNTDVAGLPTHHGSLAVTSPPAAGDAPVVQMLRSTGLVVLGKSTLPEFGWGASCEYETLPPTRNPWDPDRSTGASSGGSAALVAAGVVPIAHANDGGGSIRIPAAACGLVGLKPTRGRVPQAAMAAGMPVDIISDGVLTRSVRDTAHFLAGSQAFRPAPGLPELGLVTGPGRRRFRIGVITDSVTGTPTDDDCRAAVLRTAEVAAGLGHHVQDVALPVRRRFVNDFVQYYSMLAFSTQHFGKRVLTPDFDPDRTDALTRGLARHFRTHLWRTPGALRALRRSEAEYRDQFASVDLILTPTLAHVTPLLGHLSPTVPFDELLGRLIRYAAFTPFNNAAGGPAVSLPLGRTTAGLPVGVQFSAAHGDEQSLLEISYELEAHQPFTMLYSA